MRPRASYFASRRHRLRRKKLCTRCGAEPARAGHSFCAACCVVKRIKAAPDPEAVRAAEVARLHQRLDLIDEARRAVQAELDRITAA